MAQKYACLFYQSQAFKQNVTTKRSCHSKPHTTHVFERTIMWLQHVLTETANLWFYVYPASTLTLQFSFLAVGLVGLLLRVSQPNSKNLFMNMQIECFLKYGKYIFQPSLYRTSIYFQPCQFWNILDAFTYFKLLLQPPLPPKLRILFRLSTPLLIGPLSYN